MLIYPTSSYSACFIQFDSCCCQTLVFPQHFTCSTHSGGLPPSKLQTESMQRQCSHSFSFSSVVSQYFRLLNTTFAWCDLNHLSFRLKQSKAEFRVTPLLLSPFKMAEISVENWSINNEWLPAHRRLYLLCTGTSGDFPSCVVKCVNMCASTTASC